MTCDFSFLFKVTNLLDPLFFISIQGHQFSVNDQIKSKRPSVYLDKTSKLIKWWPYISAENTALQVSDFGKPLIECSEYKMDNDFALKNLFFQIIRGVQ